MRIAKEILFQSTGARRNQESIKGIGRVDVLRHVLRYSTMDVSSASLLLEFWQKKENAL